MHMGIILCYMILVYALHYISYCKKSCYNIPYYGISHLNMIYFLLYYHTLYQITFYHIGAFSTVVSGYPAGGPSERADWPPLPGTQDPSRIELLSRPEKMTDSGPPLIPHNFVEILGVVM